MVTEKIRYFPEPILNDAYKIGQGRFASVFMCNIEGCGEKVFVAKHMKFEEFGGARNAKMNFERESATLARFDCENIVKLIGVYRHSAGMGIILEHAQCSLGALIHEPENQEREYHLGHVVRWMKGAAEGIRYLHALDPPVVHRDIKPDNCLLFDDCQRLKLADFGLARKNAGTMTDATGSVIWMAPEVFNGTGDYGIQVDVYSWAIMFWEAVTRSFPFYNCRYLEDAEEKSKRCAQNIMWQKSISNETPTPVKGLPFPFDQLLEKCWDKDPKQRPSMIEIVNVLKECEKCCPEVTPILMGAETDDSYSSTPFNNTQETTLRRELSRDLREVDTLQPDCKPYKRSLSPHQTKPRRTHSRSKSDETLLAELKREQIAIRPSLSVQAHLNRPTRSDYSSVHHPPSLHEIHRGESYHSDVFDTRDSGIYPGSRTPVTPDFSAGCLSPLSVAADYIHRKISISQFRPSSQLRNQLPIPDPHCPVSKSLNQQAEHLLMRHNELMLNLEKKDEELARTEDTKECVVRRLQALEEYKSHIEIKRIQTTTMRDRSSER